MNASFTPGLPQAQGLYDPANEHDACGVGFVVDIAGRKSHRTVSDALQVLENLAHRGACGCDPDTGDGAGILIQTPDALFRRVAPSLGFELPAAGQYAVGMVFLPTDPDARRDCEGVMEEFIAAEGQRLLGWRDVPHDAQHVGGEARAVMPAIRQVFIAREGDTGTDDEFERTLFVIRKQANSRLKGDGADPKNASFYVCSLSARTLIYKGMLMSEQVRLFFDDLRDPLCESAIGLVHSRFSTNTFPSWELAHPYRMIAHNGEINTLRGNRNWMASRFQGLKTELFGKDLAKLQPLVTETGSDSATFDNALEFLVMGGRSLPHAMMMMVPEAWSGDPGMDPAKRAFYEYHACLMEPWDGPAAICFTDGVRIGAVLDRNGLRPGRHWITEKGQMVYASETGVLDIPPSAIVAKGKMKPGRMLLVDTAQGRIIGDDEIKAEMSGRHDYGKWIADNVIDLEAIPLPDGHDYPKPDSETLLRRQQAFGYTLEDIQVLMAPMGAKGEEALGSMGTDTPLAVLSDRPQLLYNYFKQLFAQVTNPPIDSIREDMVMSTYNYLGRMHNLLDEGPDHCHLVKVKHVVISNEDLERIRHMKVRDYRTETIPMLFRAADGEAGLKAALDEMFAKAVDACQRGISMLILSDRGVDSEWAAIPALLATAGLHHHLIRTGFRGDAGIVVETGEAREVMHFALLVGYGAGAINPYLAFETLTDMVENLTLPAEMMAGAGLTPAEAHKNYIKAVDKAILKIIAKMGISTVQSYQGAQIFEAIGLGASVIDPYFTKTASRIGGVGLDVIAGEAVKRHRTAYPEDRTTRFEVLDAGGQYSWRRGGEHHLFNPDTVFKLQHATRTADYGVFKQYTALVDDQSRRMATLRGLFRFKKGAVPVPIDEVESEADIVKRFATGAMSLGSISTETHETLAIAMNRLGAKSNTGEGGEDPRRFKRDANGDWRRSAIKQVASARFGVTTHYLANADELQIKMAQGAKPGEGGQLPGHKVDKYIGSIRHATPGVGLISPPPHHDIYSIEDLAQLIHDLKNANPEARVSVKLVAEVGVGTVAAGVAKAHSDVVLISGHDGGTGASPLTSIKHAGAPWELGLAETQQVLVMNDLRGRVVVQCDGQLKTGRDVAIATLLGAEEWGCATAPLVASGCIMMRKCHLNTCPVGVATQDPALRAKFAGKPDYVVNFFTFIARELREIMAELGFRTVREMVGRSDLLETAEALDHWKTHGLDFSSIFHRPAAADTVARVSVMSQDHNLVAAFDNELIRLSAPALERREKVEIRRKVTNVRRTVGTMLSGRVAKLHGADGLPPSTITILLNGSAGQSFGAFLHKGIDLFLEGDANDYVGKGIHGGRIAVYPSKAATFPAEDNVIVGNTCLYGATGGEVYVRGQAGERFGVRNSGAKFVVEGVGDHGCEYMTGGVGVVLGTTGRNFAAGMSGGVAFVFDRDGGFAGRCNKSMVDLEPATQADARWLDELRTLLENHAALTGSPVAERFLANWTASLSRTVFVMPKDYRVALRKLDEEAAGLLATA